MPEPKSSNDPLQGTSADHLCPPDNVPDFKAVLSALPVAVYTCDKQGRLTYYNGAMAGLWLHPPAADTWWETLQAFHTDGRPLTWAESPTAIMLQQGKAPEPQELLIQRPDGTPSFLQVHTGPVFDTKGQLAGVQHTLIDITNQKKGEEKQAMLSAIVTSSQDAIISKTLEGIITSWNTGAQHIFGYEEAEVIGRPINILIPEELLDEERRILEALRQGRKIDHFQTTRIHKLGHRIPISLTVSPVRDNKGHIIGASKIARNISRQLKTENDLKRHAENLDQLNSVGKLISAKLDVQSILQQVTDAATHIAGAEFGAFFYNMVNEQGEAFMLFTLSGAPREAFERLGMPRNTALFHPTFSGLGVVRVDDITRDPRYGKSAPHFGMPEGHLPVRSYLAVPVVSTSGTVIGGLFLGHPQPAMFRAAHEDVITSLASQAAVALDNSRLFEEVKALNLKKDEFIALASHELKTPLTSIKGYLQILAKSDLDNVGRMFIGKSIAQAEKLDALVSDLFDISKIEAGKLQLNPETFDMAALLREIAETFRYAGGGHQIQLYLQEPACLLVADRQRIEQVVTNLLTNAVKYAPGKENIEIRLTGNADSVTVSVKDEGIGLTEEQVRKVFTRFYRAEGMQHVSGLGLGLYLSHEIISRHKGTLNVKSAPGAGSEFYFTLPRDAAKQGVE